MYSIVDQVCPVKLGLFLGVGDAGVSLRHHTHRRLVVRIQSIWCDIIKNHVISNLIVCIDIFSDIGLDY